MEWQLLWDPKWPRPRLGLVTSVGATLTEEQKRYCDDIVRRSAGQFTQIGGTRVPVLPLETRLDSHSNVAVVPDRVLACGKAFRAPGKVVNPGLPEALWTKLYAYQKAGVLFAVERGGSALIADEMGLGKTLQGLAVGLTMKSKWPCLVICPKAVCFSWQEHWAEWNEDAVILKSGKAPFGQGVNIMSYGLLNSKPFRARFLDQKFGLVIVDESHRLKNVEAKRTKFMRKWQRRHKAAFLALSGTPMNRPCELFSQLDLVRPGLFPKFFPWQNKRPKGDQTFYFADRYCNPTRTFIGYKRFVWSCRGYARIEELHAVLKSTVMIRRTKDEVLQHLPPKSRERVVICYNQTLAKRMSHAMDRIERERDKRGELWAKSRLMELVLETKNSKIKPLKEYLADVLKTGLQENTSQKVLLFGHHVEVLDAAESVFPGPVSMRIDGKTSEEKRRREIARFRNDPHCQVAIMSITATGIGLTLTEATLVVFMELRFSPDEHMQAEARAHRIGQTKPVLMRYLISKGTTDEVMWRTLAGKVRVSSSTLDGVASYLKASKRGLATPDKSSPPPKRRRR